MDETNYDKIRSIVQNNRVERIGLYTMVFLSWINSCSIDDGLSRLESKVDGLSPATQVEKVVEIKDFQKSYDVDKKGIYSGKSIEANIPVDSTHSPIR